MTSWNQGIAVTWLSAKTWVVSAHSLGQRRYKMARLSSSSGVCGMGTNIKSSSYLTVSFSLTVSDILLQCFEWLTVKDSRWRRITDKGPRCFGASFAAFSSTEHLFQK
ncbi:hypothetical protein C8Q77DRAFT_1097458 [Trametes polyzona]|nr:hypothetical protein C8Q77DRAFT_1097458 [Trametes polyzona]